VPSRAERPRSTARCPPRGRRVVGARSRQTSSARANAKGKFLVVWDENRNADTANDIFAQVVNKNYTLAGMNQTVSGAPPDEELAADSHEAVACGGAGLCLVVWTTFSEISYEDIAGRVLVVK
jgi:hypothetical protein